MSDDGKIGWQIETTNDPAALIDSLFPACQSSDNATPDHPVELCAVASSKRLRWLFPRDARARGFMNSWQPNGHLRALIWRGVVGASTTVCGGWLPGLTKHVIDGAALDRLARQFGPETADCLPVIYVGTTGRRRKAVIGWMDRRGDCVAVGKYPLGRMAAEALSNEARALSGPAVKLGIVMPALRSFDETSGILLESSVPGRNCLEPFDARHRDLLLKFVDPEPRAAADIYAGLVTSTYPRLVNLAQNLLSGFAENHVRPALVHGDFIQPNLKRIKGRELALVDWEYYSPCGAPLADALFFHFFDGYFMQEISGAALLDFVLRGVDGGACDQLSEAALIDASERRRFAGLGLLAMAQSRLSDNPDAPTATVSVILDLVEGMVKENHAV